MKANTGEQIRFKRNNIEIIGTVEHVRENSVIVNISEVDAKKLDYATNKTVVRHNNYVIIKKVIND